VKQDLKKDLLLALLDRGEMEQALVFTRTSIARIAWPSSCETWNQGGRIHGIARKAAYRGTGRIQEWAVQSSVATDIAGAESTSRRSDTW